MSKTILVVDDSPSIRKVVAMVLMSEGFQVFEAGHGEEALQFLDGREIDLIVSDLNMPVMDGIGLAKEVNQMDNYKHVPILMLTTESNQERKMMGKEAGVKAWLVKPFQPPLLLKAVAQLL